MTHADLAAIFRRLADEMEKMDAPPAVALASLPSAPDPVTTVQSSMAAPPVPPPVSAPPAAPAPATGPKPVINLDTVKGIQTAFNLIRSPNHPRLEEDGVDDKMFSWVLKEFQATIGIPVTGKADETTLNALHKALFGTPRT